MKLFEEFSSAYLQFTLDEILGIIDGFAKHITHGEELRHAVVNDAAVWRDADFAIGECVQSVDGLIA